MDEISDALERASQEAVHRPIPTTTYGQAMHLLRQAAKADLRDIRGTGRRPASKTELARRVATQLGIPPRTVERWRDKKTKNANPATAAALTKQVLMSWQPRIKNQARHKAATTTGITIETRARFGYSASARTTDDARERRLTVHLPPVYAARLFEAQQQGASAQEMREIAAKGFQEVYFQNHGSRAQGLEVEFTDITYFDVKF